MTIDQYQPPADTIAITPQSMDFFYAAPGGNELVGMMLHTERLGSFAVLFTPEGAHAVARSLTNMAVHDIDRLRREHDKRRGTEQ
ncbi:hypothetical protein EI067_22905 [Mycobacterium paragordonae]|uniref:hypothetical protein n=1 Tax=Mycobacterium paragordonae TaxID=1389713 RepID=UPI00105BFE03|nr:hypothetical protein [Mycobacterium paragordonae]TDK91553.1 hypothetical protein EI067_22905 [Mycobacterium paragordonae]